MYLPIHVRMEREIKAGAVVIHNGGGKRQGFLGRVTSNSLGTVYIKFDGLSRTQYYSLEWFLDNFYIHTSNIICMKKFFKGDDYLNKYKGFSLRATDLSLRKPTHASIKAVKDLDDEVNLEMDKAPSQDPLDVVGEYLILAFGGQVLHVCKTLRIAQEKAKSLAASSNSKHVIAKVLSETEAVTTINIKNL